MNIREIAKKANVSTATVSRVLNGSPHVSEKTRKRVLKIIREYNYVPNGIARSMSHGKTSIIGLVLPDITNPFFPDIARGVEDSASTFGYKVILCNSDNERHSQESYLRMLREQRVDGLILISSGDIDEERVREIVNDIPVVWCDRAPKSLRCDAVYTDHYKGTRLAVRHLIELGHRQIAMISGPPVSSASERLRAFLDTCSDFGVDVSEDWIVPGDYRYESGYHAMKQILRGRKPTAVFCSNDMMALGAIDAILNEGLRVSEDISVVGYDNILFSRLSRPSLTTVNQPTYLLGVTAMELLADAIENRDREPIRKVLEPTLVVRNSTARVNL